MGLPLSSDWLRRLSCSFFHNGDAKAAIDALPPQKLNDAFAITVCKDLPDENCTQEEGKKVVSKIADLKLDRHTYEQQYKSLQATNPVYRNGPQQDQEVLTRWCPDPNVPAVPPPLSDCVVTVPVQGGVGGIVRKGPAESTEQAEAARNDIDAHSSAENRYISALEPEVHDFNAEGEGAQEVVTLLQQLEELENAAARSVAVEMESAAQDESTLIDHLGRKRILALCDEIRTQCQRVSSQEKRAQLEKELQDAVMGASRWLHMVPETSAASSDRLSSMSSGDNASGVERSATAADSSGRDAPATASAAQSVTASSPSSSAPVNAAAPEGVIPHLHVARGKKLLSLWDWTIWTMVKPKLWRCGDACNLYPERETALSTNEWAACMLLREEMEYTMPGEPEEFKAPLQNRIAVDWVALHLMATVCRLTDQRASAYHFLKNGGMAFANRVKALTSEALAQAARSFGSKLGLQALLQSQDVLAVIKDALNAMQMAMAHVIGTDGHRRLCRHEGVAYMETFGPPLIFTTPNPADTQQPLFLIVQGQEVRLDARGEYQEELPKYRDMMRRVAQDPVSQTVMFELLIRLFLQVVLNVRPETLACRRQSSRTSAREWCTDGVAAASSGAGMLGPVLAFRGEVEAQGRGSLHPHILVWLVCKHLQAISSVLSLLEHRPEELQRRLREFMRRAVASSETLVQASAQASPRLFRHAKKDAPEVPLSKVARSLSKYDGGTDLDLLRELPQRTEEQEAVLQAATDDQWRRPNLAEAIAPEAARQRSIYATAINELPVAQQPSYRRRGPLRRQLRQEDELGAEEWEERFYKDIYSLLPALLKHVCTESCYKYSENSKKTWKICRHGFYYMVALTEDCKCRRKGKPLGNKILSGCKAGSCLFNRHPSKSSPIMAELSLAVTIWTCRICVECWTQKCGFKTEKLCRTSARSHLWLHGSVRVDRRGLRETARS